MPGITAGQLSFMRNQVAEMLPDTGTILSGTPIYDGQGGSKPGWAGTTAIDCRVDVVNGREALQGGGYKTYQKTMLTLPYNATITPANRFAYGSNQYNVVAVSGSDRSWNVSVRAELEKV